MAWSKKKWEKEVINRIKKRKVDEILSRFFFDSGYRVFVKMRRMDEPQLGTSWYECGSSSWRIEIMEPTVVDAIVLLRG